MPVVVDEVLHHTEVLSTTSWGDEPAFGVGESIEDLAVVQARVDLTILLAVRSFEARAEHRAEGHASVVPWLQHHLRMKTSTAQRYARLSRFVTAHPVLEEAMRAGTLGLDHVDLIRSNWSAKAAEAWEAALPRIVEHAPHMRFSDLARDLQAFADRLRPRDAEGRYEELLAGRRFQKLGNGDLDGYGMIRGWLDPVSYPIFANEHDRLVDQLFRQDWETARELLGRDPDPVELAELTRTHAQRAADAVIEMARRSKAHAGGTVAAAVEVVLHTTLETYQAALRHKLTGEPLVIPPDGFCETDDGTPLSPVAAVYASIDGLVRRLVLDAEGVPVDYGTAIRAFTDRQKGAIRSTFRRCTHPYGCDRTGPLLQIDHEIEVQDGGPTDLANGSPKDGPHNRTKSAHRKHPPRPGVRIDTNQRRGPPRWC
ncbi:MAG TPA: DUF222 domain-containing protein [Acidimicrobiales bacterium]|nr:DUF222 domain-containing protein [Acidimicrobiales bacterium]